MNAESVIIDGIKASNSKVFLAALTTAKLMHSEGVVDALIEKAASAEPAVKKQIVSVLMRLHQKEAPYEELTWWGTRPDLQSPYVDAVDWHATPKISLFLKSYIEGASDKKALIDELKKNKACVEPYVSRASLQPIELSKGKKIKDTAIEDVILYLQKYKPNIKNGAAVIKSVGCVGCHNIDRSGSVKGPDLAKLGHVSSSNIAESILKPGAAIAESWVMIHLNDGSAHLGTLVSENKEEMTLHNIAGMPTTLKVTDIAKREPGLNMMSLHLCDDLSLESFGDLIGYIKKLDKKGAEKRVKQN